MTNQPRDCAPAFDAARPPFSERLTIEEREALQSLAVRFAVAKGDVLRRAGEVIAHVYVLLAGALRLGVVDEQGREHVAGFIFDGDSFGVAIGEVYPFTIEALTAAEICRFDRRGLIALSERFPRIEHRLLSMASNEFDQCRFHVEVLTSGSVERRLMVFLENLRRRHAGAADLSLAMTQTDIAAFINSTPESVNRAFAALRRRDLLTQPSPHRIRFRPRWPATEDAQRAIPA